jgi:hypothetical protein
MYFGFFYLYVSVSDLYISTICLPILLQQNRWTDRGNISFTRIYLNVMAAQFQSWEYINRIYFAVYVRDLLYGDIFAVNRQYCMEHDV